MATHKHAVQDYACICFADATHGAGYPSVSSDFCQDVQDHLAKVVHLSSGQWVALRAGHVGSVCSTLAAALMLRNVLRASVNSKVSPLHPGCPHLLRWLDGCWMQIVPCLRMLAALN